MTRILLLMIALGAAAIAAYALLSGTELQSILADSEAAKPASVEEPGHDQIDEQSRERLREILREADSDSSN